MRIILAILLLAPLLGGCAGTMYSLPPLSDDERKAALAEINEAEGLSTVERGPAEARALVADVADRLEEDAYAVCDSAGYASCYFNVSYKADETANAWASGDGDITITSELMKYLQNEEEVAAVIAHEMGHHVAQHVGKAKQNTTVGAVLGGIVLGVAVAALGGDASNVATATSVGISGGAVAGRLSYSREHEAEADYLGIYLLERADYDLDKASQVWARLAKKEGGNLETGLFDTHPSSPDRLAAWKKTVAEVEASPDKVPFPN